MQMRVYADVATTVLKLLVAVFVIVRELVIIGVINQNKLGIYQLMMNQSNE